MIIIEVKEHGKLVRVIKSWTQPNTGRGFWRIHWPLTDRVERLGVLGLFDTPDDALQALRRAYPHRYFVERVR